MYPCLPHVSDSLSAVLDLFAVDFIKTLHMDSNAASASLHNTSPPKNPAEVTNLQTAFAYQSNVLKEYRDQLAKAQVLMTTSLSIYDRCHHLRAQR